MCEDEKGFEGSCGFHLPGQITGKMEAVVFLETNRSVHQCTWCHVPLTEIIFDSLTLQRKMGTKCTVSYNIQQLHYACFIWFAVCVIFVSRVIWLVCVVRTEFVNSWGLKVLNLYYSKLRALICVYWAVNIWLGHKTEFWSGVESWGDQKHFGDNRRYVRDVKISSYLCTHHFTSLAKYIPVSLRGGWY